MEINIEITASTISVVAAIISFISMCCAVRNAVISKKNLKLQEKKYNESKPNFKVSILFSNAKNYVSENNVTLKFFVLFTNLSDKGTSLKNIKLRIIGETNKLILIPIEKEGSISCGENLGANNSKKGWLEFELDGYVYKELQIIKYELEVTDIYNNTECDEVIHVMEEVVENEK